MSADRPVCPHCHALFPATRIDAHVAECNGDASAHPRHCATATAGAKVDWISALPSSVLGMVFVQVGRLDPRTLQLTVPLVSRTWVMPTFRWQPRTYCICVTPNCLLGVPTSLVCAGVRTDGRHDLSGARARRGGTMRWGMVAVCVEH